MYEFESMTWFPTSFTFVLQMGNDPVHYISAHPSKIHGLDWSPNDEHKLVTASQDCTIRVNAISFLIWSHQWGSFCLS